MPTPRAPYVLAAVIGNPPVAGTKVVNDVVRPDLRQLEHRVDDLLRGGDEDDVWRPQLGRRLRSRGGDKRRNDR